MKVTKGELLRLVRHRLRRTMAEFPALLGISEDRLRDWELDRAEFVITGVVEQMFDTVRLLTAGEVLTIQRRRHGYSIAKAAFLMSRSRVSLINAEHDRILWRPYLAWWEGRGWIERGSIIVPNGQWAKELTWVPR